MKRIGILTASGDGALNGLQPLAERLPTVLAPETIDNDNTDVNKRIRYLEPELVFRSCEAFQARTSIYHRWWTRERIFVS